MPDRKIEVVKPCLILVEGKDDWHLVKYFVGLMKKDDCIQVEDVGGLPKFKDAIRAWTLNGVEKEEFRSLGIVRDMDNIEKEENPLASMQDAVKAVDLKAPPACLKTTRSKIAVTFMIMPAEGEPGSIETLLLKAIGEDPAMACVDQYLDCIEEIAKNNPEYKKLAFPKSQKDKARLYAWLASRKKPGKQMKQAIEFNYIDKDSEVFEDLRKFIELVSQGKGRA